MNMKVGSNRDDLDKSRIRAATFHPTKDEWYVVYEYSGQTDIITFEGKICSRVDRFLCPNHAMKAFLDRHCGEQS